MWPPRSRIAYLSVHSSNLYSAYIRTHVELEVIPHDGVVLLAARIDLEPYSLTVRLTQAPKLAREHSRPHDAAASVSVTILRLAPPETLPGLEDDIQPQL